MRHLLLTRGIPGSGKSYTLEKNGLIPYTISPDQIRLMFNAPIMSSNGKIGINQGNNKRVWEFVFQIVEERMDRGEFIVVDATHKTSGDFQKYIQLAKKYLYEIHCLDFSHIPLETCLAQNAMRLEYKQVPEEVIKKHHQAITSSIVPKTVNVIKDLNSWISSFHKTRNMDEYSKLHFIGDIQGCFEPVREYFKNGFAENEFYIFTGDFLDRGIQNGQVLKWVLDNAMHQSNVLFIMGNHERHLVRWAADLSCKDAEFEFNTLPQILQENITKDQVSRLVSKMHDCMLLEYHGRTIFVNHAGLGTIPKNLVLLTSKQYWNGTGAYGEPIDLLFSQQNHNVIQVHGHRNTRNLHIHAASNSFNLEGKIEFGGELRIVTFERVSGDHISGLKATPIEIRNEVYNKDLIPRTDIM